MLDPAAQETPSFRFSVLEFCNGAIIALVSVTPAAGFIHPKWAPLFGIIPSILCSAAHFLNEWLEDPAYITVIHGVGGFVGMLMTGLFAQGSISALDGLTPATQHNGAFYGNPAQFG